MAFPLDPTNGQQTTQNGIVYIYNATLGVWAVLTNTAGNISAGNIVVTNSIASGTVSAVGNVTGGNLLGTIRTAAQPNITSVGTLSSVSATGNVTGNYFIGNGSQLTGLPESYTNANVAAYLPTYTGNLVSLTGAVTTTANVSAGNILTDNYLYANGSPITGGAAVGGGTDQVFFENDQSATANYAIPNARNAMTVGPLVVDNGVVITIPDGGRWIVL
jgi:hypothetical protein